MPTQYTISEYDENDLYEPYIDGSLYGVKECGMMSMEHIADTVGNTIGGIRCILNQMKIEWLREYTESIIESLVILDKCDEHTLYDTRFIVQDYINYK